jgi:hypothetical protein
MSVSARDGPAEGVFRHAFVSYVRDDSHLVDRLQHRLESAGVRVWRDTADLWPGEDWRARIRQAIRDDALVFIACFSRESLAREKSYQNEELALAIEELRWRRPGDPWLIPVRFSDCDIPDIDIGMGRTLRSIQRADLFGDHEEESATRLVLSVLRILGRTADTSATPIAGHARASKLTPNQTHGQAADPAAQQHLANEKPTIPDVRPEHIQAPEYGVSELPSAAAGNTSPVSPERDPSRQDDSGQAGKSWRDRLSGPWLVTIIGGLVVTIVGGVVVALITTVFSMGNSPGAGPAATAPVAPIDVKATAASQYTVTVTWADRSAHIAGFRIDNGCPLGACGGRDAELYKTIGPVTSTGFTVTPGSWTCFRVQAYNSVGESGWSGYGCTLTRGLLVPGTREWTDTGVTLNAGDRLAIKAAGTIYINSAHPVSPSGASACIPAANYASESSSFPARRLPCWSLIARIGSAPPFEVGTTVKVIATTGRLYLGVNVNSETGNSGNWTVNIAKGGGLPPPPP